MAASKNLKINFGADTSGFDKGAKQVKKELNSLNTVGSTALNKLGSAFGVNIGKVQEMQQAMSGLGREMQRTGTDGAKALGQMIQSVSGLAAGIAGLGIGAAVIAFKSLNEEASLFKKTVEGANMEMATAAYIDTYRQSIRELNGDTSKTIAETQSKWKEFWGTLGSSVKQAMRSGLGAGSEWMTPADMSNSMDDYVSKTRQANTNAEQAKNLSNQLYELERKRKEMSVEIAQLEADKNAAMLKARDTELSAPARLQAINEARDLINKKYEKQLDLQRQIAAVYKQMVDLPGTTVQDADNEIAARAQVNQLLAQESAELAATYRLQGSLSKEVSKEAKARKEAADALAAARANLSEGLASVNTSALTSGASTSAGAGLNIKAYIDVDKAAWGQAVIGMKEQLESSLAPAVNSLADTLGTLLGDIFSGSDDAAGNFANGLTQTLGGIAQTVGGILITTGLGMAKLTDALTAPTPASAAALVAAGAALVAIGAAAKAAVANTVSGGYSASSNVASSTSSTSSSDYVTRTQTVTVTGTLTAQGNQLVAVINNENKRKNHTT